MLRKKKLIAYSMRNLRRIGSARGKEKEKPLGNPNNTHTCKEVVMSIGEQLNQEIEYSEEE